MKKVFFLVHISTQFNVLYKIAELLNRTGKYRAIMYLDWSVHELHNPLKYCIDNKLEYILSPEGERVINSKVPEQADDIDRDNRTSAKNPLTFLRSNFVLKFFAALTFYRKKINYFHDLLQKNKIDLVIMPDDGAENNYAVLVKAAHRLDLKVIVCPFSALTTDGVASASVSNKSLHINTVANWIPSLIFPEWKYSYNGVSFLRSPAHAIWAMKILGIAPALPWMDNNGHADAIAVDSLWNKKNLERSNPAHKLILTGGIEHDTFAKLIHNKERELSKLYANLGITNKYPMILCALPGVANYLDAAKHNEEFTNGKELLVFYVKALTDLKNYNVIINFRPGAVIDDYKYLQDYGAVFSYKSIDHLVPLSHLFVSSFSATIRMAISCGVPVMNYDVLHHDYNFYDGMKSVITIRAKNDYNKYLHLLTEDISFYESAKREQQKIMQDYAVLDGKAEERILDLINQFVKK